MQSQLLRVRNTVMAALLWYGEGWGGKGRVAKGKRVGRVMAWALAIGLECTFLSPLSQKGFEPNNFESLNASHPYLIQSLFSSGMRPTIEIHVG